MSSAAYGTPRRERNGLAEDSTDDMARAEAPARDADDARPLRAPPDSGESHSAVAQTVSAPQPIVLTAREGEPMLTVLTHNRDTLGQGLKNTLMHRSFKGTLFGIGIVTTTLAIRFGATAIAGIFIGLFVGVITGYAFLRHD